MSEDLTPTTVDMLYLDMEHFVLTTESGAPLEPKERVVSSGGPSFRLFPHDDSGSSEGATA